MNGYIVINKKHWNIFIVVSVLALALLVFIGLNNISTTQANYSLEKKLKDERKAHEATKDELQRTKQNIIEGTCLTKLPSIDSFT